MKIFGFIISLVCASTFFGGDIYSVHFRTIDNEDRSMEEFRGKKIMIIILPVTQTVRNSALLRSLVSASENYADKISLIGILSFEQGYNMVDSNRVAYYH